MFYYCPSNFTGARRTQVLAILESEHLNENFGEYTFINIFPLFWARFCIHCFLFSKCLLQNMRYMARAVFQFLCHTTLHLGTGILWLMYHWCNFYLILGPLQDSFNFLYMIEPSVIGRKRATHQKFPGKLELCTIFFYLYIQ